MFISCPSCYKHPTLPSIYTRPFHLSPCSFLVFVSHTCCPHTYHPHQRIVQCSLLSATKNIFRVLFFPRLLLAHLCPSSIPMPFLASAWTMLSCTFLYVHPSNFQLIHHCCLSNHFYASIWSPLKYYTRVHHIIPPRKRLPELYNLLFLCVNNIKGIDIPCLVIKCGVNWTFV